MVLYANINALKSLAHTKDNKHTNILSLSENRISDKIKTTQSKSHECSLLLSKLNCGHALHEMDTNL